MGQVWAGGVPDTAYHALNILGPPDCNNYGECYSDLPWTTDLNVYPQLGQRVRHVALTALVTGHDTEQGTVSIEYLPMYKRNPDASDAWQQCAIDPAGHLHEYPDDCTFELRRFSVNEATGRVNATVARAEIGPAGAGVWCPRYDNYVGSQLMEGGGAFGPEYVYSHRQAPLYTSSTPPHTEWIEVSIATPVYIVQVEVGAPRGMGSIVAIRVEDTSRGVAGWPSNLYP